MPRLMVWIVYGLAAWLFVQGVIDVSNVMSAEEQAAKRAGGSYAKVDHGDVVRGMAAAAFPVVVLLSLAEGLRICTVIEENTRRAG